MEIINGILVQGISDMVEEELASRDSELATEEAPSQQQFTSSLAGFIIQQFGVNRDARRNSGIDDEMFDSLRAYNGEYSPQDLAAIRATGGSEIFINITGVKSRAAASWIRDIQLPAKLNAWLVEPTPVVELPTQARAAIEESLNKEFGLYIQNFKAMNPAERLQLETAQQQQQQQQQQPGVSPQQQFQPVPGNTSAQQQPDPAAAYAAKSLKEFNQAKRDIEDMVLAEINKIARHEMKQMELEIADKLAEGGWQKALSDFIDDFTIFPTAFIKAPIISRDSTLSYQNGQPVLNERYLFLNKRVSPLDMYPSPNSTTINDGSNLIEHCRFTRRELLDMKGLPGYDDAAIIEAIKASGNGTASWVDTGIEGDKADAERRGSQWEANQDVIHGLHFHGSISAKLLTDWGMENDEVALAEEEDEFEVDAILAGNHVIRCALNQHPLKRRPYYKASYQTRPGSFWGRSLPSLMNDLQRMCNAVARALSNNIGLASGPQIEIYVDRLADKGKIEAIHPFKIWQLNSDPTGGTGRAINFFQPTSNAAELLKVYQEFELRADDATGIPRYSYGNERVGGAAQTATGLSMLLESASKAIKDCVRNIDEEVIIPRIEMQFYWSVRSNPNNFYTGDPKVIARGSSSLTMKGAEQMRRNEFLQLTANPFDMQIVGLEGRAELLRAVADDLNLGEDFVPSRLELRARKRQEDEAAASQQQRQFGLEEAKINTGLQATQLQIDGQKEMHAATQQLKMQELQLRQWVKNLDTQLRMAGMDSEREREIQRSLNELKKMAFMEEKETERFNTEVALKLQRGEGI